MHQIAKNELPCRYRVLIRQRGYEEFPIAHIGANPMGRSKKGYRDSIIHLH